MVLQHQTMVLVRMLSGFDCEGNPLNIEGCTNPFACYNPAATVDTGCTYLTGDDVPTGTDNVWLVGLTVTGTFSGICWWL